MTEHRNDETTGTGRTDMPEGHGDKPSNPDDARWQQRPDMTQPSGQGGQGGQGGQEGQGGQGQTYGQGREGLGQEGQGSTWRNDEDESEEGEKTHQEQGTGTPR